MLGDVTLIRHTWVQTGATGASDPDSYTYTSVLNHRLTTVVRLSLSSSSPSSALPVAERLYTVHCILTHLNSVQTEHRSKGQAGQKWETVNTSRDLHVRLVRDEKWR